LLKRLCSQQRKTRCDDEGSYCSRSQYERVAEGKVRLRAVIVN
jgi:hypothetical protein